MRQAQIRQRDDTIVVDNVTSEPTMVVFDDGNRILKSLTFDQPTAWLATQLRRDADLWDREWVLSQLVQRPTDAAAARAVADAVTSADHPYTRAIAASAMDAFPADVALPALTRALHDTSARVRASAADGLGGLSGPEALTLARTAWERDSSYAVRASAVTAIARLDPTGRRDILRQALSTPSYQDAIQNAALGAIARSNDTSMIGDVERVVGDQALPSRVLVAFGARGNQHALDLLTMNLNDDRGWVRGWTLAALESIEPNRQLAVLESALPKVTRADIRAAVERAIMRLRSRR